MPRRPCLRTVKIEDNSGEWSLQLSGVSDWRNACTTHHALWPSISADTAFNETICKCPKWFVLSKQCSTTTCQSRGALWKTHSAEWKHASGSFWREWNANCLMLSWPLGHRALYTTSANAFEMMWISSGYRMCAPSTKCTSSPCTTLMHALAKVRM